MGKQQDAFISYSSHTHAARWNQDRLLVDGADQSGAWEKIPAGVGNAWRTLRNVGAGRIHHVARISTALFMGFRRGLRQPAWLGRIWLRIPKEEFPGLGRRAGRRRPRRG